MSDENLVIQKLLHLIQIISGVCIFENIILSVGVFKWNINLLNNRPN